MTIRLRLTLWYGVAIAATVVLVGAMVWIRFAGEARSMLEETLAVQVADVTASIDAGERVPVLREDPARPEIFTMVMDSSGTVIARSRNAPTSIGPVAPGKSTWRPPGATADDVLFAGTARSGQTIIAGSSLARSNADLERLAGLLVTATALASAASLAGGWLLARQALAPVSALVSAGDEIHESGGPLGRRLQAPHERDELGQLAAAMNRMLDRVERSLQRQRTFVAVASHDLRTPIAALRIELELLLRHSATADELRASLEGALEDVIGLGQLADDLLGLAAAEGTGRPVTLVPVDVGALAAQVADRVLAATPDAGVAVDLHIQDAWLATDHVRIEQVLANLLGNAVVHSPPGETVTVSAHRVIEHKGRGTAPPMLEVDVLDRGPGVDASLVGDLFVPFARSDGRDGGVGLGLATADAAVRALGGRIGYRPRPGGGSWFWFRVPAVDPA